MGTVLQFDTSKWAKPKVEKLNFFKGISKILVATKVSYSPNDALDGLFDAIGSIKFERNVNQLGWLLVWRSMTDALIELIFDQQVLSGFDADDIATDQLEESILAIFKSGEHGIENDFFEHPEKMTFLKEAKPIFRLFLDNFPLLEEHQKENVMNRYDDFFAYSLAKEWRRHFDIYQILLVATTTPFDSKIRKISEWRYYQQYLKSQTFTSVMGESFGLCDVYIPLRAYYEKTLSTKEKNRPAEKEKHVVCIETYLLDWVRKKWSEDNVLKVITGGPGYGKSSMLKMLAAKLAKNNVRVLFIPLHHFNLRDNFWDSLNGYFKSTGFLESCALLEEERLLIIFDGLDELAMRDKLLANLAKEFIDEIRGELSRRNSNQNVKLKVILSGRDLIIQENSLKYNRDEQVLHLLEYYVENTSKYVDEKAILNIDQRQEWWQRYGALNNKGYDGLPKSLKSKELIEITSQPLLNFLVAMTYERGNINFSDNPNLNKVYADLINQVHARKYDGEEKTLKVVSEIDHSIFHLLLQEIAIATWHSNARVASVADINRQLKEQGIENHFKNFLDQAKKGMVSLLAAFYFQQSEHVSNGDETFEFTHKSFAEYLIATRVVEEVVSIVEEVRLKKVKPQKGLSLSEACVKWINLFGPKELDVDIIRFIENEFKANDIAKLEEIQDTLMELINYQMRETLPMEKSNAATFKEMTQMAIHAESALLILRGLIADITKKKSDFVFNDSLDARGTIMRSSAKRASYYFSYFNISRLICHLSYMISFKFDNSEIKNSIFSRSYLNWCTFDEAHLINVDLDYSVLNQLHLKKAYVLDTSFNRAIIRYGRFDNSTLKNVNFVGAILENTYFEGTKLDNVNFSDAIFIDTYFSRDTLAQAKLTKAQRKQIKILEDVKINTFDDDEII